MPGLELELVSSPWGRDVFAAALDHLCALHARYLSSARAMSALHRQVAWPELTN